jgi:hypothetical protein
MAHRTTIWRRKQRLDDDDDLGPRVRTKWCFQRSRDGKRRRRKRIVVLGYPGRREKSEARDSETLDLVAQWMAEKAMQISPGADGPFRLKAASRYARKEIGKLPYPANMIAAAVVDGLGLGRIPREQARISRRMMCYWKKNYSDHLDRIKKSIAIEIDLLRWN